MNDREAIKHLTNDWFKSLGGQLCVDGDKVDGFLEAVGIGISALQEREERARGCEYCRDDCCPQLDWRFGLDHILPDYMFCPMCGRKLKGADSNG